MRREFYVSKQGISQTVLVFNVSVSNFTDSLFDRVWSVNFGPDLFDNYLDVTRRFE